jgi:signal transduction histidine kinase
MKKVALVFVVAVLAPSLVLAWLAVRSLRDQQFLLERQQSLLDQHVTDLLAQNISDYLAQQQQSFSAQVESLAAASQPQTLAADFDGQLCRHWSLAEVGFCVTASGKILSPLPNARPAAQMFRLDNSGFLGNREPVEVYLTANNANASASPVGANAFVNNSWNFGRGQANQTALPANANSISSDRPSKPELAMIRELNEPAAANVAPGQAFSLQGNAGKNASPGPTSQIAFAINGSAANFAAAVSDQRRRQMEPVDHSAQRNSSPTSPVVADGNGGARTALSAAAVAGAGDGTEGFYRHMATRSAPTTSPVLPDAILPTPQPEAELATAKKLSPQPPAAGAAAGQTVAPDGRGTPKTSLDGGALPRRRYDVAVDDNAAQKDASSQAPAYGALNFKAAQSRMVSPQSQIYQNLDQSKGESAANDAQNNLSKVVPAEAEFRQLIGDQSDGMIARFLQNKLKLMCWHRLNGEPDFIFGAQLNLARVVEGLRGFVQPDRSWGDEICLAVLDDNARPVVISRAQFQANWKRPFVATEVGDALPHWEAAAYLVNPARLTQAAHVARLTLGLLVALLVIAIGIGSLLIVRSLGAELKLARQKTDFVSNVSHELKTPLTSIRMFSELLAEGRVADPAKQHSYLQIITAEASRLTRLINNVLDFSRLERGEKKYNFQLCDLGDLVLATAETFRPHLESAGFQFACELPAARIPVRGDADALSQVIVNLLSNAEKYSASERRPVEIQALAGPGDRPKPELQRNEAGQETGAPPKEILLRLTQKRSPLPYAEIKVLDRGPGVPRGCEEKVFEKFYRAHVSLSSGIQGSGLGLTIARQIARAHGGDVVYEPRDGGGSCFVLRLPILTTDENQSSDR